MKKLFGSRMFLLVLGVCTIIALVFLAAALPSLEFKGGQLLNIQPISGQLSISDIKNTIDQAPLDQKLLFILAVVVIVLLGSLFLDPEQRKPLIWTLLFFGMLAFIIYYLAPDAKVSTNAMAAPQIPVQGQITLSSPTLTPPVIPPVISYALTAGVVMVVLAATWFLLRKFTARRKGAPLEELAGIAQSTIEDIQAGQDWEDAVVRCYLRMTSAISNRRDIRRQANVTPTEFALQLEQAGLPGEAIQRLTTLFERVRYGAKKSNRRDIHEAVDCLTIVLHACRDAL